MADLLKACLESIAASQTDHDRIETIVVDSASHDHTLEMLRTHFPQVKVLPQAENIGFTRANNIGLRAAQGRYMMLLNPDTELDPQALTRMIAYMEANPSVGILGPQTRNTDGTPQSTRRRFPNLAVGFFESTWLQPYAPRKMLDHYYVRDVNDDSIADVDWVQGSALIARRAIYAQIGALDEGYVMYSEELDWCKRAKSAGWRVVYFGNASIIHHGGKSSEQVTAHKHIHFQESKLRYFRKFHGRGAAHSLRLFLLLSYLVQMGIEWGKSRLGHKKEMRQERIHTYWQVIRSGLKVT